MSFLSHNLMKGEKKHTARMREGKSLLRSEIRWKVIKAEEEREV